MTLELKGLSLHNYESVSHHSYKIMFARTPRHASFSFHRWICIFISWNEIIYVLRRIDLGVNWLRWNNENNEDNISFMYNVPVEKFCAYPQHQWKDVLLELHVYEWNLLIAWSMNALKRSDFGFDNVRALSLDYIGSGMDRCLWFQIGAILVYLLVSLWMCFCSHWGGGYYFLPRPPPTTRVEF